VCENLLKVMLCNVVENRSQMWVENRFVNNGKHPEWQGDVVEAGRSQHFCIGILWCNGGSLHKNGI